jgi:CHAD domain-containing protein
VTANGLKKLQDVLGTHQDAVVATDCLHHATMDLADPKASYAAGRLAQVFDDERRKLHREWRRQWERVRRAHRRL